MTTGDDQNAAVWQSRDAVEKWVAVEGEREAARAAQRQLMADLLPFGPDEPFTFLDLGAGTGAAARAVLGSYPRAEAVLADFSDQMMAEGARAMAPYDGRYRYVAFDMITDPWAGTLPDSFDAVVSSQCVHHVSDERKATLFAEIHAHLAPGGWYLNFDPVSADDPIVAAAWRRAADRADPGAAAKAAHRTPDEQARWENHIRYIAPLDRQLGYLRAAGFQAVDVFWKHLDSVIYGGCRVPQPT
ncbi:MAG: class I SAM-dependent methyltransferase [Actinomycetota bacterium]|nr:class I SAM-dependent methyltransferase [Actinomycetota bacterium]